MVAALMAELVQIVEEGLHAARPPLELGALHGLSFAGEQGAACISGMAKAPRRSKVLIVCLRRRPGAVAPELVLNGRTIPCTRSTRPVIVQELATQLSGCAPARTEPSPDLQAHDLRKICGVAHGIDDPRHSA